MWEIVAILLILWRLGVETGYTMGWYIHILPIIACIVLVIQAIQGRKIL